MLAIIPLTLLTVAPLAATGLVTDQTARASGVGGAYVAQVDDASAVFFNPGALALLTKKKGASAGMSTSSFRPFHFQGRPPGAQAGTVGEQSGAMDIAPSLFGTKPYNDRIVLGAGVFSSLRTRTEWEEPDAFAGRHLATAASIQAYDVTTAAGVQLTPWLGVGASAVYRMATLSLDRRESSTIEGTTTYDIAELALSTDTTSGVGWNAGLLVRPSPRFSLGLAYRSPIALEMQGVGTLTQIPTGDETLDTLVAESLRFGENLALTTRLETPAQLSAGVAFAVGAPLLVEVDVNRTQWKQQSISIVFPNDSAFDRTYPLAFEETLDYRAGLRFQLPTGPVLRVGYAIEKSPQPDAALSPFLALLDRNTISGGVGLDWLDVSIGWSTFGRRSVVASSTQFNGDYSGNEWTVVITATK